MTADRGTLPSRARRRAARRPARPVGRVVASLIAYFVASVAGAVVVAASGAAPRGAPPPPRDEVARKPQDAPAPAAVPPLDLSDRTIRRAIADSRDALDDPSAASTAAFGAASPARRRIDRAFADAEVPSCLAADALARDRPVVGAFGLGGFLVLPWWAHAIVTGRCRH